MNIGVVIFIEGKEYECEIEGNTIRLARAECSGERDVRRRTVLQIVELDDEASRAHHVISGAMARDKASA